MKTRHHGAARIALMSAHSALLAVALVAGCLLAACGATGDDARPATSAPAQATSSPASSASPPAPGSSPLAGSPEQAVAAYWTLVDKDAHERLAAVCVPGSPAAVTRADDDIARVRLLRVTRVTRDADGAQVQVDVRVTPAGEVTPWGAAGRHTLFVQLLKSGSGWLVASWGTSP
jgi:hypothetical protein